ncbi:hypothetical protein FNV43_RR01904 [Rhamnella rubrinervis]|uniref:ADP-ribosyl cyclase/cyclic ADP-ribose hydrolase n=1 Tax=Rhamnella rubrinervis TaxID=2594499 RepID=A0A8K0HQG8_9ROSA|nr:hypothetical protein FNV43_RR01904 [Rhamnella rubrinervis]
MKAITYIGVIAILYTIYKYISDGARRRDPRRSEGPLSLDASSPSSSNPQDNYQVFLSFRGETGKTFTSHLYEALDLKGIYTFLDVKRLERGEDISPGLDKAIEGSHCAVVVVSENYASSRWCMDELVKILQCRKDSKIEQIVLPIFYHVNPDDIIKEKGTIWKGFQSLKKEFRYNQEKVKTWRDALIQVANIAGHHVHDGTNEALFIEDFINVVSSKLDVPLLNISKDLVGMDSRLKELKLCVSRSPFEDVRFIGICGFGGLGKTTLARAYFKIMSCQFQASSFLANVREVCENEHDGLVRLQKQLLTDILKGEHTIYNVFEGKGMISTRLCRKKILVVLDDVDQLNQLEGLAEKNNWFGCGSQIIVTTRDESLLKSMYEKKEFIIHKVDKLNYNEALHLFSSKAFKSECPLEDYRDLSAAVIEYASGLPLALVVLGSFLRGKTIDEWKSALDRLKEYPENEIMRVLRISFDGLRETEKNIFLDIACFFNGSRKDYVMNIMDRCGFFPEIGIRSLVDKSLLHMDDDSQLRMHDLLEEMGKEIVREKSRDEPGRRSRVWLRDDFYHVLNNDTGTKEVEAIVCRHMKVENISTLRGFSNMKKVRLLIVRAMDFKIDRCPDNEYLPNELRLLEWYGFPFKSLPRSFQPHRLVELILNHGKIERLWDNPMMKTLNLDWCDRLEEIDPSIKYLKKLTLLSLNYCKRLKSLPASMSGLESLEVLELYECSSLKSLPESIGVSGDKLQSHGWKNIWNTIGGNGLSSAGLSSLKKLDLSCCHLGQDELPYDFGCLVSLEYLNLGENYFFTLPECFNRLSKLKDLHLSYCYFLISLGRQLPDSLECVMVNDCERLSFILDPLRRCLRCSTIFCINCFALVEREGSERMSITSLRRYLQNPPKPSKRFDIVLPGNEIPSWFTHRVMGSSSISLPLHPNWCANKWMGFALSVCFIGTDKWHNKLGHIQFAFKSYQQDEKFIRCGVRLVYEKDIEELNCQAIELQDEDADCTFSKVMKNPLVNRKMEDIIVPIVAQNLTKLPARKLNEHHLAKEVINQIRDVALEAEDVIEAAESVVDEDIAVTPLKELKYEKHKKSVLESKLKFAEHSKGKRYLIVMEHIWKIQIRDEPFLDENEIWKIFCWIRGENSPSNLETLGKQLGKQLGKHCWWWLEQNMLGCACPKTRLFTDNLQDSLNIYFVRPFLTIRLGAAGGGGVMEFMWRAVAVKMFIYTL